MIQSVGLWPKKPLGSFNRMALICGTVAIICSNVGCELFMPRPDLLQESGTWSGRMKSVTLAAADGDTYEAVEFQLDPEYRNRLDERLLRSHPIVVDGFFTPINSSDIEGNDSTNLKGTIRLSDVRRPEAKRGATADARNLLFRPGEQRTTVVLQLEPEIQERSYWSKTR